MSTTRQLMLADVDYSDWANQQLLAACSVLTPDQLTRDLGASHRSVLETLRHIFYAERVWRDRLIKNALPPLIEVGDQRLFADAPPEPSLEDLKQKWPTVAQNLRRWLEVCTEQDLLAELSCLKPDGEDLRISPAQIIIHSVNHSTLHRGQIITMLRSLGIRPPNTDQFSFYMTQQQTGVRHNPNLL
jgi:uncharacterized damage-inducible protein DinB